MRLTFLLLALAIGFSACLGGGNDEEKTELSGSPSATRTSVPTRSSAVTRNPVATPSAAASVATATAPPPAATVPPAAEVVAEDVMLNASDFPPGWVHLPWNQAAVDEFYANPAWAHCYNDAFAGERDRAYGGEYSDYNTTLLSINPAVFVFDSQANAEAGVAARIREQECFAEIVGDGMDISADFAFGEMSVEALTAGSYGAYAAIRLQQTQIYKNQNPPDSDVLVFDVVYVVNGSVVAEITGFQRYFPISESLLSTYVEKARQKIQ